MTSNFDVPKAKPFIKWVGGKRNLLNEISPRAPKNIDVYFEPFLGGGEVFFHLADKIKQAFLSDSNEELISCYWTIQNTPQCLIDQLSSYKNTKNFFIKIRQADRDLRFKADWSMCERAARFIYLNKTCFNGLYRVNSKGQFNVPYGNYKNPKILDKQGILDCHSVLCKPGILFRPCSYKDTIHEMRAMVSMGRTAFVYLDPPFAPISKTSSFVDYSKDGFSDNDQIELKSFCDQMSFYGIKWMMSNSHTDLILNLYKNYTIETVLAKRNVAANSSSRHAVKEVLIRNYV